ncbi:MAG: hypothetical protein ACXV78_04380 [Candidatus Angelobacter sp.]
MALEKTFREFSIQLRRLGDRLQELRVTVVEDKPSKNDAVIVDNFEYAVEDLLGWLNETLEAARKAECAVEQGMDLNEARRALTKCQEQFHRLEQDFNANLLSYEKVKDLTRFGSERRGHWQSWVSIVKQGIEQCRQPLEDAGKVLAECWQEIAEKVGTTSISVRTTNIGQKIARAKEPENEGVT